MLKNHETVNARCLQGRHGALSALISLSFAVTLGGCSGENMLEDLGSSPGTEEADPSGRAENTLIESHLRALGYDTSELQFRDDAVIVEGDMAMSRALLLDEAQAEASGLVEKGYFKGTTLFAGKRIALSFASNVSSAWQTAFIAARNVWNNSTPMFARDPGNAATISVVMGTNLRDTLATGSFPPNRIITLNADFSASCGTTIENIPANSKQSLAVHEIGHVLGFDHPPPGPASGPGRVQIAGTSASAGTSVMRSGSCNTGTTLSSDDVLSATKKYPSCVATCENNCLSLGNPGSIGLCQSACLGQCGG